MPPPADRHSSPSSSDVSLVGEIGAHRDSSGSDCLSDEVDLESGELEVKVYNKDRGRGGEARRDCRICHLGLEGIGSNNNNNGGGGGRGGEEGIIELGCSCKGDLGAAHRKCAETWFKIKGNTICEICGATAINITGEQTNQVHTATAAVSSAPVAPVILVENQTIWHSRRVMNFLLACMVLAFVISWLFHFKILS